MILKLYKTDDDYNVINKTLTDEVTLAVNFRKDFNILSPEIYLTPEQGLEYLDYNYCYIQELDRYYYINSIDLMNASLYRLNCRCDYLETYKTDILNSECNYSKKIVSGDYGVLNIDKTGREIITNFVSDLELNPEVTNILTIIEAK